MSESEDRIIERVVVMGDDQGRIEDARARVREYMEQTGRPLDIWSVNGLRTCLSLMDRYLDLIILNYAGLPKDVAIPIVRAIRDVYPGRLLLVNEDPTVDSCEWGRRHRVDHHVRSVDAIKAALPRVLESGGGADKRKRGRTALVLAGGGILGGFNEAGSLKALYDFGIRDFDMYMGISAGAVVGACAANGARPEEIIEHQGMGQLDFYYPNWVEALDRAASFVPSFVRSIAEYVTLPHRDSLFMLSRLFTPSAFLSNRRIQRQLERIFKRRGATNSFRELRERGKELYVMAVDLDAARPRIFGDEGDLDVPISEAVAASCALPIAYAPVRVDGRDYMDGAVARTASLDVAIERGADLIVCISPLVPYTGGSAGFIKGLGLVGVIEQAYRIIIQERLHTALDHYRQAHPHVTIILIEPDMRDPTMFHNPLNAGEGLIKLAALHGFKSTKRTVEARYDFIRRAFHYHGRPITREVVDEEFEVMVDSDFSAKVVEKVLQTEHVFE
jgi:predicted acylesterase/phospholipase RssA